MANSEEKRLAGGYLFSTEKDARLAETERKKIAYLESRIDYSKPEDILYIYDKTINDGVFKTPVGISYLKQLQEFLLNQSDIDPGRVAAIPLSNTYNGETKKGKTSDNGKTGDKEGKKGSGFAISVILNVLLVLALFAMFIISLNSDQPNIINYEKAITNKYAGWEQELTERERVIREKERELMIEGELTDILN